uniref:hypothetical protein n=1 Tax=Yersinia frederiksenii TaxID=29484 RepID=UPI001F4C1B14|nr:hypothetical protein [Yersinia frederiksenii]ULG19926.1 hypothetical protein 49p1_00226 [Yersinia frederiksenii]
MLRTTLKIILLSTVTAISPGCLADNLDGVIYYKVKNNEFILKKSCVEGTMLREVFVNGEPKPAISIFFEIKDDESCSGALNKLFRDNIGATVTAVFNKNNELATAKIVSEMKTENGFSQYVPDKKLAMKIINSYNE